jgi:hypothetical protein
VLSAEDACLIDEITGFVPRPASYDAAVFAFVMTVPSLSNATAGLAQGALGTGRRNNMRMFEEL